MEGYKSHNLYFEDLHPGQKFKTAGRTIFEADIVNFVSICGMHEELFTNLEYINTTPYWGRIVPGALTFSFAEGLAIQSLRFAGIAFLGMENFRILRPVYCNDTIRVEVEVIDKRPTSKEDRGIVKFKHTVFNHKNERVLQFYIERMLKCRQG